MKNHEPEPSWNETSQNTLPYNTNLPPTTSDSFSDFFNFSNQSVLQASEGLGLSSGPQDGVSAAHSAMGNETSGEVVSLGLEEALPTQEAMDEL